MVYQQVKDQDYHGLKKERNVDLFDVKRDVVQTLVEAGYNSDKFFIDSETPNYYHPGKSGRLFLNRGKDQIAAYFWRDSSKYHKKNRY